MIPLAHAAHWALYALPVFLLTLGLTVLALVEGRSARRKARREDDDR
jgi:cytochrome c-type biogenesis protein CcmH/NrfF